MSPTPPPSPMIDTTLPHDMQAREAQHSDAWEAVGDARTRTLDALAGFEKMAEHAETDFVSIVQAFVALHTRHGEELTRLMTEHHVAPEDDGSFMATVNRVVVATRAFFDKIDEDVLSQIHSGERHVLDAYDKALTTDLPQAVRERLSTMHVELRELLDDTHPAD